jgi:transposase
MTGTKVRAFAPLCNRSVEDLVPGDNLHRHLEAKLDLGFVRDLVRSTYKECGRPSVDPRVFFNLQLVMFFEGLRSERELVRVAADRLSVRWYLGYDPDEELPDHSSLTRIRRRYGLATLRRFFEAIIERCREAGLVWGKSCTSMPPRSRRMPRWTRSPHASRSRRTSASCSRMIHPT